MSTWWDRFNQSWASTGALDDPTPAQADAGWTYIGQAPPTVEQFNSVHQWWDNKDNWLYNQIATVITKAKLVPAEDDPLLLWESIKFIFEAPNDGTIYARGSLAWQSGGTFKGDITATNFYATGQVSATTIVYSAADMVANNNITAANGQIAGQTVASSTTVNAGTSVYAATDVHASQNMVADGGFFIGGYGSPFYMQRSGGFQTVFHSPTWYDQYVESNGNRYWVGDVGSGAVVLLQLSAGSLWCQGNINAAAAVTAGANMTCSQSLTFINSTDAAIFGTTPGSAVRFYSDGTGNNFQQLGIQGWGSIMSYNTQTYPTGGGAWSSDINGNTAQRGTCSATGFPILSDESTKMNVQPWAPDLDKVLGIETVSFQYRNNIIKDKNTHYGVTAQQIQTVLPEAIVTLKIDNTTKIMIDPKDSDEAVPNGTNAVDVLSVDMNVVLYACVNAIKQLSARLDAAKL
jgi:hypothetical protein